MGCGGAAAGMLARWSTPGPEGLDWSAGLRCAGKGAIAPGGGGGENLAMGGG